MGIKLNVGASPIWQKSGWVVLDHKATENTATSIKGDAIKMGIPDNSVSVLFCSHMLEHVPHFRIQRVLLEFSRVIENGGVLRLLTPDLYKLTKAYIEKDEEYFRHAVDEDESIRRDLGFGGMLMNFLVSPGQDTVMLNRSLTEFVGGYAHHYSYDYEMMRTLLSQVGFGEIRQMAFGQSDIPELTEPYHVEGLPTKWEPLNQDFYKKHNLVHEYRDGKYNINFKTTGFDRDPYTSLIIEAKKFRHLTFSDIEDINGLNAKNYNRYGFSLLRDPVVAQKFSDWGVSSPYKPDLSSR